MASFTYPNHGRAVARSAVILLAVVGAIDVAEALLDMSAASAGDSVAFARSLPAAEPSADIVTPYVVDWSRAEDALSTQPRECDMAKGIATECVFMD
jgi:hypothetical protein